MQGTSWINYHQEDQAIAAAGIDQGMGDIGPVRGGIARVKQVMFTRGFNLELAFDPGDEFPRAREMSGTAQGARLAEGHFVKLHVLFQMQRTEGTDTAVAI